MDTINLLFFVLTVIALCFCGLTFIPLFFVKSLWVLPGRLLFLSNVPVATALIGYVITAPLNYDPFQLSRAACVVQGYLISLGFQGVVAVVFLYVHLVYMLVIREVNDATIRKHNYVGSALIIAHLVASIIANELTGGMTPRGPFCASSSLYVVLIFPFYTFGLLGFLMVYQCGAIMMRIWRVTQRLESTSSRDGSGKKFRCCGVRRSFANINFLYLNMVLLCLLLAGVVWATAIRRSIQYYSDQANMAEYVSGYIAYPIACMVFSIVILTSAAYRKIFRSAYRFVFGPCCDFTDLTTSSSSATVSQTESKHKLVELKSDISSKDLADPEGGQIPARKKSTGYIEPAPIQDIMLSPAAAFLLSESGWDPASIGINY